MANFNTVIKARAPRYRTIPLFQTPRRSEVRPTPVVLPVDDPLRSGWFPTPGNREETWVSLGNGYSGTPPPPSTRHAWPFAPIDAGSPNYYTYPGLLDYALNVENLISQVVPDSAGRGVIDPRRAGYDLIARIYSVKRWNISGSLQGQSFDASWGPYTRMSLSIIDGAATATESAPAAPSAGREMVPLQVTVSINNSPDIGDTGQDLSVFFALTAPGAGFYPSGWSGRYSFLGAGLDAAGNPVVQPAITGSLYISDRLHVDPVPSVSEPVASRYSSFSPAKLWHAPSSTFWEIEESPVTLCGYALNDHVSPGGSFGDITGSITIDAEEFWGPDEWPS